MVDRGRQGQAYSEGNEPETVMDGGMRQEKGRDERMTEENRRLGNKTSSTEKGKWSEDEVATGNGGRGEDEVRHRTRAE